MYQLAFFPFVKAFQILATAIATSLTLRCCDQFEGLVPCEQRFKTQFGVIIDCQNIWLIFLVHQLIIAKIISGFRFMHRMCFLEPDNPISSMTQWQDVFCFNEDRGGIETVTLREAGGSD